MCRTLKVELTFHQHEDLLPAFRGLSLRARRLDRRVDLLIGTLRGEFFDPRAKVGNLVWLGRHANAVWEGFDGCVVCHNEESDLSGFQPFRAGACCRKKQECTPRASGKVPPRRLLPAVDSADKRFLAV